MYMEHEVSSTNPLISVLIPVYNVEKYLDRCLTSIVENDYRELQIVCVNDGSTDASGAILANWKAKDSRIQVVTTENQGPAEARNTGIRLAEGQYVSFIDSDDWIHPQYFRILLEGIVKTNADVSKCDAQRVGNENEVREVNFSRINWKVHCGTQYLGTRGYRFSPCGKLFRKDLIHPDFNSTFTTAEDVHFLVSLIQKNPQITFATTEIPLYYYFARSDSNSATRDGTSDLRLCEFFVENAEKALKENNLIDQDIFLLESCKRILSYRYDVMFDKTNQHFKPLCARAKKILLSSQNHLSLKEKFLFYCLLSCPYLYRRFRIANDPSLKKWEKGQKEKYKNMTSK